MMMMMMIIIIIIIIITRYKIASVIDIAVLLIHNLPRTEAEKKM